MVKIAAALVCVCEKERERVKKSVPAAEQYAPGPLLWLQGIRRFSPTIYFLVCDVPRGMFFSPCSSPFVNKLETSSHAASSSSSWVSSGVSAESVRGWCWRAAFLRFLWERALCSLASFERFFSSFICVAPTAKRFHTLRLHADMNEKVHFFLVLSVVFCCIRCNCGLVVLLHTMRGSINL